jgi:Tol biopolymer transport system component
LVRDATSKKVLQVPLDGDHKPRTLLETPFNKHGFELSPDQRWVAYFSTESGRFEIYIAAFPSFGDKRQVSNGGGVMPAWSANGKELFFIAGTDLMAVDIKAGAKLETSVPKKLFSRFTSAYGRQFAPSADGKRFLIIDAVETATTAEQINVVLNWAADLLKKPADR